MRKYRYIFVVLGIMLLFVVWFFYLRTARENRLMKDGNVLVSEIEQFKVEYKRLPSSLKEIGIEEQDGKDALYYDKKDSLHYIVWFGVSLGESKTYYSDSKQWEDFDREIKGVSKDALYEGSESSPRN